MLKVRVIKPCQPLETAVSLRKRKAIQANRKKESLRNACRRTKSQ